MSKYGFKGFKGEEISQEFTQKAVKIRDFQKKVKDTETNYKEKVENMKMEKKLIRKSHSLQIKPRKRRREI